MALLKSLVDGRLHRLMPTSIVGRGPRCDVRINDRRCSTQHAMIRWEGRHWLLQDLASRNGTWVEGDRIDPQHKVALTPGLKVAFGNPPDQWEVQHVEAAVACAVDPAGTPRFAEHGLLSLPDDDQPTVFVESDDNGTWFVHDRHGRRECDPEMELGVGGQTWRVVVPGAQGETTELQVSQSLSDATIKFIVSLDEERVISEIVSGGVRTRLDSRSHSYLLLLLGRQRLNDRANGLDADREGWVELSDLATRLGVSENEVNVQVFRARRQLRAAEIGGAARVIERTARRLRLGLHEVSESRSQAE